MGYMRISKVRSFLLSYPFDQAIRLPFYGGERTIVKRDAMLIRIETDAGLVGYAPGPGSERAQAAIERTIAPFLEGRTLADPDALRVLFLKTGAGPEIAKVYCAVEVGLYDLCARQHGIPLSEMVGGRVRDRIRLYGSAGMYMPPEAYAAEAAAVAELGFRAYKMRPALGPEQDVETVRLMRQAVGPDFDLMVDAHTWWRMGDRSYSPAIVEQLAEAMADYQIAWLEEPMPPDDHEAYLALRDKDIVPLASGEHEPSEERYLDLIESHAVDYVQMDVCCQGGFAMGRRLFSEIAREGLKFAFHSWGTALEVVAAAHLGICWPEIGGGVARIPVLFQPHARRNVSVPAGRRNPERAAADRPRRPDRVRATSPAWVWRSMKPSSTAIRGSRGPGRTSASTRPPKPCRSLPTTASNGRGGAGG